LNIILYPGDFEEQYAAVPYLKYNKPR